MQNIKFRSNDVMSEIAATDKPSGKKGIIIMIVVTILAIGAGAGGAWFLMQGQQDDEYEPARPKKIPTAFKELDTFTVNLQPEERNQYLQVGLTIKIRDTDVSMEIDKKMPEIRNRVLLLLTSKTAADLVPLSGKQQLSTEIIDEIRKTLDSEVFREEVMDVLFTSFVIQ
jgi:flagellar FliL protein